LTGGAAAITLPTVIQIHGTCVEIGGRGVLLRGPSGSGKSDLALRLIDGGARLIADDRVDLVGRDGRLMARAPSVLAGRMEVRGIGIVMMPYIGSAPVALIVDLVPSGAVERLPEAKVEEIAGISLPRLALAAVEPSAPAKIRLAIRLSPRDIITS